MIGAVHLIWIDAAEFVNERVEDVFASAKEGRMAVKGSLNQLFDDDLPGP